MKRSTLGVAILVVAMPVSAQHALLYKVPLDERVQASDVIVEGRVGDQRSYWSDDGSLIFTASTVEIYRVFKGEVGSDHLEVVTPGGTVGMMAQLVQPSLRLSEGDVGVFMVEASAVPGLHGKKGTTQFVPVASVQGMVRYDEVRGLGSDVFSTYGDIKQDLHDAIAALTGEPAVLQKYVLPVPPGRRLPKTGMAPSISSVSPGSVTAGTNTVITISGTGFETYDGGTNSKVFFASADDGGSTTIFALPALVSSWTNTRIQVRVPARSGTGAVTVQTASLQQATSTSALTVEYNLINVEYDGDLLRSSLASKVAGGYSMRMSSSTADGGVSFAGSDAVAPFERALLNWQETTGLNIRTDGADIDSSKIAPNSQNDIITFETNTTPLPSGILGRASSGFTSCDGQTWIVMGIDLQFRRDGNSVTWNYGPGPNSGNRADFESVALHELGHAHQLGHVIAPGKVLHYALTSGTDVRILDTSSDIAGGNDVLDFSQDLNTFCGRLWTGMQRLVEVGLDDERTRDDFDLSSAYPNPTSDGTAFTVLVERTASVTIDLYDLLGRRVSRIHEGVLPAGVEHRFDVETKQLPAGVYFYTAAGPTFQATRKLVLLD